MISGTIYCRWIIQNGLRLSYECHRIITPLDIQLCTLKTFVDIGAYSLIPICLYLRVVETTLCNNFTWVPWRLETVKPRPFAQRSVKQLLQHKIPDWRGLCQGNPSVTGGVPVERGINAGTVSLSWRHHSLGGSKSPHCRLNSLYCLYTNI